MATSNIEAELLALVQIAKEAQFLGYLLKELTIQLDNGLTIQYDNLQTIRLVTREQAQLTTRLRHVDIYNHWLR